MVPIERQASETRPTVEYTFSPSPTAPAIDQTPELSAQAGTDVSLSSPTEAAEPAAASETRKFSQWEHMRRCANLARAIPQDLLSLGIPVSKHTVTLVQEGLKEGPEAAMSQGVIEATQENTSKASSSYVLPQVCPAPSMS
jgi:hypothetical protein